MNLFSEASVTYSGGRYIIHCPFDWNSQLKSDGWSWDARAKLWITTGHEVAKKYMEFADTEARAQIEKGVKFMNDSYRLSRAIESNFEVQYKERKPFSFQRAGVAYIVSRRNTLLGDDMGSGKSAMSIMALNHIRPKTCLIVCPKSLKLNWFKELGMWLAGNKMIDILKDRWRPYTEIGIIHYDALHKLEEDIKAMTWDMLICDEAHVCRNSGTKRSRLVMSIRAERKLYLTGTPIVNRPKELWPLIHSLDPNRWASFTHFAERYCKDEADEDYQPTIAELAGKKKKTFGQYNGAANLEELQNILRGTIMIRRLKAQILPQLPKKIRQIVELEPEGNIAKAIAEGVKEYKRIEEKVESLTAIVEKLKRGGDEDAYRGAVMSLKDAQLEQFSVLARQRVESARMKLPYVIQYLEELLEDTDEKFIVFGHHKEMLGALYERFETVSVRITGDVTSDQKRQDAVDRFQTDPSVRFFFGQFVAAGVGITLTASSNVIFAEMDWVPGNISQAEDRANRIGAVKTTFVMHIVLQGSIDAYIMKRVVEKQEVIERAMDLEAKKS